MSKSFNAAFTHVFANPAGSLCVLDVMIKDKYLRLIGAPNDHMERSDLFRRIGQFLTSRRVFLA